MRKPQYSPQTRKSALTLAGKAGVPDAARILQIPAATIYRWIRREQAEAYRHLVETLLDLLR